ncbi:AMP-dependent synthetase/ligase in alkane synthesis cluster [hydrothermal vent metagenome]|uniref:AMP-dependent synthetase/ligase in alkane synthesis cluster n=1 Tax=hydrothermal vent metagenome TaxID=652676 RepID=A0A3B1CUG0_9ZZZZ
MSQNQNIAELFTGIASRMQDRVAIHVPCRRGSDGKVKYRLFTFRELDEASDRYAVGFANMGIGRDVRTLLMVRPGFDFVALTFALFKVGAVSVLIDPGMGKLNLLECIKQSEPSAMVAVPKAYLARLIYPSYFKSIKHFVTVGRRWFWGGTTAAQLSKTKVGAFKIADTRDDDIAAILFTTGSTGPPKGVVYTHGIFTSQVKMIKERYGVTEDDVDLPAFPLFALFSAAMGMSVVIPDMDPTRPGDVDPAKYVESINDKSVTFTFGSPAIWKKVSAYCVENKVKLPTLKRVLMAGAPVADEIHERLLNGVLPDGATTHTPFGATECLPACDIMGAEVLSETAEKTRRGMGVCVGRPLPGMKVEIIKITDEPIDEWNESLLVPGGETGEIVFTGPVVTKEYFKLPRHTRLAKIKETSTGDIKHRMGDVGHLDEKGRLWFLGRKGHRVVTPAGTLFTIACEAIFNRHPAVERSALVGIGDMPNQKPVIIVELKKAERTADKDQLKSEILKLGSASELTSAIQKVLFHPSFPTDIRHNAKIFREKLKVWAEGELKK